MDNTRRAPLPRTMQRVSHQRMKNFAVAAGLVAFVGGVYAYTIRAVGGNDEMEAAIEQFEKEKVLKEDGATS